MLPVNDSMAPRYMRSERRVTALSRTLSANLHTLLKPALPASNLAHSLQTAVSESSGHLSSTLSLAMAPRCPHNVLAANPMLILLREFPHILKTLMPNILDYGIFGSKTDRRQSKCRAGGCRWRRYLDGGLP